jgi:hypothetical protein
LNSVDIYKSLVHLFEPLGQNAIDSGKYWVVLNYFDDERQHIQIYDESIVSAEVLIQIKQLLKTSFDEWEVVLNLEVNNNWVQEWIVITSLGWRKFN